MMHVRHYWTLHIVTSRWPFHLYLEWCDTAANDWSIVKMKNHHCYPWIRLHCRSTLPVHCNGIYNVLATYHEHCSSVCALLNAIVAVILLYRSVYTVTHCDGCCFLFATSWCHLWLYRLLKAKYIASHRLALMSVQFFLSLTHHFCLVKL